MSAAENADNSIDEANQRFPRSELSEADENDDDESEPAEDDNEKETNSPDERNIDRRQSDDNGMLLIIPVDASQNQLFRREAVNQFEQQLEQVRDGPGVEEDDDALVEKVPRIPYGSTQPQSTRPSFPVFGVRPAPISPSLPKTSVQPAVTYEEEPVDDDEDQEDGGVTVPQLDIGRIQPSSGPGLPSLPSLSQPKAPLGASYETTSSLSQPKTPTFGVQPGSTPTGPSYGARPGLPSLPATIGATQPLGPSEQYQPSPLSPAPPSRPTFGTRITPAPGTVPTASRPTLPKLPTLVLPGTTQGGDYSVVGGGPETPQQPGTIFTQPQPRCTSRSSSANNRTQVARILHRFQG